MAIVIFGARGNLCQLKHASSVLAQAFVNGAQLAQGIAVVALLHERPSQHFSVEYSVLVLLEAGIELFLEFFVVFV
jgi:hypothetical protein